MIKNNKGFSLIELMVVVAIIGILASFAIPQYQSFQGKARQKEGQTLLNSYFVSVKSVEAETGGLYTNFVTLGFNPTGQIHYRITAGAIATPPPNNAPYSTTCNDTQAASTCTVLPAGSGTFTKQYAEVTAAGAFYATVPAPCAPAANAGTGAFVTCASAFIKTNPTQSDLWSINQLKALTQVRSGLL